MDKQMMELALEEAGKCDAKEGAFSVGCVLVAHLPNKPPSIISVGYSRELPGNTHAEANALEKARALTTKELGDKLGLKEDEDVPSIDEILRLTHVYTTLEPCSVRTSGLAPCADALVAAHISRCAIGAGEPDDYVQCEGARKLKDAGIQVDWLKGLEKECLAAARKGLTSS
ncbi:cytidine deaminase-like protein [Schizopora paradoxa]|uniref:Cytidine deaminase-like protein n=1 Tax=Schizopora paradoxa TaxID=27342 RepID=A0A0H2RXH4_9AGAM|nr:cytidine deaminase-like protein [Schizopora paradoxa]